MNSDTLVVRSFPPIARRDARVLIMGTAPGIQSLARRQFYGHPQNAFWRIMGELFDAGLDVPYAQRKRRLTARGIAVWDVLEECQRHGSMDHAIAPESVQINDFAAFFARHRCVSRIFFNGHTAEALFRRHVLPTLDQRARSLVFTRLPSTSPAHAGRSFAEKLAAWRAVAEEMSDVRCKK
ncbi:MAG: DNA-deoxyinosine glycosylase [Pirellulales bacterium]